MNSLKRIAGLILIVLLTVALLLATLMIWDVIDLQESTDVVLKFVYTGIAIFVAAALMLGVASATRDND